MGQLLGGAPGGRARCWSEDLRPPLIAMPLPAEPCHIPFSCPVPVLPSLQMLAFQRSLSNRSSVQPMVDILDTLGRCVNNKLILLSGINGLRGVGSVCAAGAPRRIPTAAGGGQSAAIGRGLETGMHPAGAPRPAPRFLGARDTRRDTDAKRQSGAQPHMTWSAVQDAVRVQGRPGRSGGCWETSRRQIPASAVRHRRS
jgi:hypothetical protein